MSRLYYTDSYTTFFEATITERTSVNGAPAVVLSQSYFYPTSGGQPNDIGTLNQVPVNDVIVREPDGAVLHILDGELTSDQVRGEIDWTRRFDHMQHHTGQHILSQAFVQAANAETISFHLSPDSVTIDLNVQTLTSALIDAAEELANQIVAENRAVRSWFPTDAELEELHLRKVPDVDGKFRVVHIANFDANACGGTHVAFTGEVGLIKVLRTSKNGEALRVEFCCGMRALRDYREKNALLNQLATDLTTGYWEIPTSLERLREQNKALQRDLRAAQATLLENEAQMLWQSVNPSNGYTLVIRAFENRDPGEVRQIVQSLIAHPATIALCGLAGEKAQLIMARSEDLTCDMVPLLKKGLASWGVERGGGRPSFAQGGGASATVTNVETALQEAARFIGN
jgi:alanyl-tRNA synthetase